MELITSSRLRAFRACKRLHFFRYELLRRPLRQSRPPAFGTVFHAGLEQWWLAYKEPDVEAALSNALHAIAEVFHSVEDDSDLDGCDLIRATELMRGYDARWRGEMEFIRVLAVEAQFEGSLVNPDTNHSSRTFKLGGKIDVIVEVLPGHPDLVPGVYLIEHKTTTKPIDPGATYWTRLRMDPQISTYHRGAELIGHKVIGTIYDVARRPTLELKLATPEEDRKYTTKQSKLKDGTIRPAGSLYANQREHDETETEFAARVRQAIIDDPNTYYQRGDVTRLEEDLYEHAKDTWLAAKDMRDSQRMGSHPRNPDACERYNRFCEYWDVCTNTASIDDDELFRTSQRHEELSPDAKAE